MWNVICRYWIGVILAIAVLVVVPARVQTQSSTPVRVFTQNLGFNGGTTGTIDTTGANLLVACVSSTPTGRTQTFQTSMTIHGR